MKQKNNDFGLVHIARSFGSKVLGLGDVLVETVAVDPTHHSHQPLVVILRAAKRMFSVTEIETLCKLLQASREKAIQFGDYESAIEQHDQVIRKCCKLQNHCDLTLVNKFEIIKEKCRYEIKLFHDILFQLNELKKPSNSLPGNGHGQNQLENYDPDVWAPPTPIPSKRNNAVADDNLPSWAKLAPQPSSGGGRGADHLRRQSNEENNSRVRRKDPIPENRRRS
jgi:hypothetical protein